MAFPTATITQGSGLTINTLPNAGQGTMANSLGVAIASDQSPVPVTIAAVIPASQSGVWTVQIGNTPNTTAIKVDGSGVTSPVSAVALPLPVGASTAAKQPALGTAGAASADVISVQGISSMTPLKVDGSGVPQPVTINAGANAIGSIIGRTSNPSVTPSTTVGAYTAGQEVGGLMTFAIGGAGSGLLESIRVTCKSVQATSLKLYIFDTNPTNSTWSDKTTPAINAADVSFLRGVFLLSSPDSGLGTHTIWNLEGIACSFIGASLYGVLVCVGTPTFASASDITVKLGVVDD
jgi:hypothetical protein